MPSVYLIQYSVSSTETPGKSFLPLRRKRNGASVRERSRPRWCKVPYFSSVSQLVLLFISLATPVRFRDTAASETQQPQRHSSCKSSTLYSNRARSRALVSRARPFTAHASPVGRVWSPVHTLLVIFPTIPGESYFRVYCYRELCFFTLL